MKFGIRVVAVTILLIILIQIITIWKTRQHYKRKHINEGIIFIENSSMSAKNEFTTLETGNKRLDHLDALCSEFHSGKADYFDKLFSTNEKNKTSGEQPPLLVSDTLRVIFCNSSSKYYYDQFVNYGEIKSLWEYQTHGINYRTKFYFKVMHIYDNKIHPLDEATEQNITKISENDFKAWVQVAKCQPCKLSYNYVVYESTMKEDFGEIFKDLERLKESKV